MDIVNKEKEQKGNGVSWKPYDGFCYPNVLVMGQSGVGKTRSICNLDPNKTIVILTEKSTLTFPNAKKFYDAKSVVQLKDFARIMKCIQHYSMKDEIDTIIVDSFTGLWKSALKLAQSNFTGFAVWDNFSKFMEDFLDLISDIRQSVICLAHSEKVLAGEADSEYEVEVVIEGKKIKKLPIASNFELTLFAKKEYKTENDVDYVFYTNALRHTPAKSPEGMLDRTIPNDLSLVINKFKEYYG